MGGMNREPVAPSCIRTPLIILCESCYKIRLYQMLFITINLPLCEMTPSRVVLPPLQMFESTGSLPTEAVLGLLSALGEVSGKCLPAQVWKRSTLC